MTNIRWRTWTIATLIVLGLIWFGFSRLTMAVELGFFLWLRETVIPAGILLFVIIMMIAWAWNKKYEVSDGR